MSATTGGGGSPAGPLDASAAFGGRTGWFGKLPTLGDFASRRLPPEFVSAWDAWLSAGLAHWQRADAQWPDSYLQAPSLRFVLGPSVLAPSASGGPAIHAAGGSAAVGLAGVLMPSLDRVGRLFPLTLVRALADWPPAPTRWPEVLHWMAELDQLALSAMQDDWPVDQLEDALQALDGDERPDAPANAQADDSAAAAEQWLAVIDHGQRTSLWCPTASAIPRCRAGLPAGNDFLHLFGPALAGTTD